MSVYKKLMQARIKLQNTELKKSGHNKFAGYTYFELGDFLPQVNTIFDELGLCGVISYGNELATLTIVDSEAEANSPVITITSPMAEANLKGCHPIQNLGAVETYTRRYLWVAAMELVEHDALDSSEPITGYKEGSDLKVKSQKATPTSGAWESLTEDQRTQMQDIIDGVRAEFNSKGAEKAAILWKQETDGLPSEAIIGAWSKLPSEERSKIKDAGKNQKGEK